MAFKLRPYQITLKNDIYKAWESGFKNVLAVMPTGGGKTKTFCEIAREMAIMPTGPKLPTAILVHRKELVSQISLTLAEVGIVHNIIAPRNVIKGITAAHRQEIGRQYYNYQAPITVVSVDTLNARGDIHSKWAQQVRFWITDEATHLLQENKWGQAVKLFSNAIGLGVTATPRRLDKKGLGSHADGVFDMMVTGPTSRWLIDNGFLCKYRIVVPQSDYETYLKKPSETSDYSKANMTYASQQSHIIGDVLLNYQKFANGKQAILFTTDIATGERMEQNFNNAGVSAKLLTAETPDAQRLKAMIDYRKKLIKVLINVDLFDEGLDVPGIEVVIMARPTASLSKYLQCCGRGLRPMEGKPYMILIDHVGNVRRHGLPDDPRNWTLDRIKKRGEKISFMRICHNTDCNSPYDRSLTECPFCGEEIPRPKPGEGGTRPSPEMVDGDLFMLDPETIRELEAKAVLESPEVVSNRVLHAAGPGAAKKAYADRLERIRIQQDLAEKIAKWAGVKRHYGYTDRRIQKEFYLTYGRTITEALGEDAESMKTIGLEVESSTRWN